MAIQESDAIANAKLDLIESTIGTAPLLRIRNGTKPANCAAARAGTVLVSMTLPSDWLSNASGRTKSKSGTWQGNAGASGFATHFEVMDSTGTTCHLQDLVSQPWAGSTVYALNQQVDLNGKVYKCTTAGTSATSGGPSGTGTGISDGTCVWDYVGPLGMSMSNTSIQNSQQVTVSTFALTGGN